jgi:hypothetical protein
MGSVRLTATDTDKFRRFCLILLVPNGSAVEDPTRNLGSGLR